ncbi:MAG: hypothetical protein ACJ8AS_06040, partial [Hyphomicrobiales bacterium]
PVFGPPLAVIADLAVAGGSIAAQSPWIAAHAAPWPGELLVLEREGESAFSLNRRVGAPAIMGELLDGLPRGPVDLFDRASGVRVKLYSGALASLSEEELLAGANIAAIGDDDSGWEIVQFRDAVLVAASTFRIAWLLRGRGGSEPEIAPSRPAGSRFMLLDPSVVQLDTRLGDIGVEKGWRIGPATRDHGDPAYVEISHVASGIGLRPLSPVHLRGWRDGGDVVFSWTRRTRIDGDGWELAEVPLGEEREAYDVEVLSGGAAVRTVAVQEPRFRYSLSEQAADFGTPPSTFTLRIFQLSAVFGRGAPLEATVKP